MEDKEEIKEVVKEKTNDLSYEAEKKLDKKERRRKIRTLIGSLITAACFIGIIAATAVQFPIGVALALGLVGSLSVAKTKISRDLSGIEMNKYNQEIEHLEKVEKNGIKNTEKLNKLRADKIEELSKQKPEIEKEEKSAEDHSTIAAILALSGAAIAAVVNPWVILPAVVAEIMSISFGIEALDKNGKLQNINNRIDNLTNDLKVTDTMEEAKRNSLEEKIKTIKSKKKINSEKSKVAATEMPKEIDDFVEKLADTKETSEPKKLTK